MVPPNTVSAVKAGSEIDYSGRLSGTLLASIVLFISSAHSSSSLVVRPLRSLLATVGVSCLVLFVLIEQPCGRPVPSARAFSVTASSPCRSHSASSSCSLLRVPRPICLSSFRSSTGESDCDLGAHAHPADGRDGRDLARERPSDHSLRPIQALSDPGTFGMTVARIRCRGSPTSPPHHRRPLWLLCLWVWASGSEGFSTCSSSSSRTRSTRDIRRCNCVFEPVPTCRRVQLVYRFSERSSPPPRPANSDRRLPVQGPRPAIPPRGCGHQCGCRLVSRLVYVDSFATRCGPVFLFATASPSCFAVELAPAGDSVRGEGRLGREAECRDIAVAIRRSQKAVTDVEGTLRGSVVRRFEDRSTLMTEHGR